MVFARSKILCVVLLLILPAARGAEQTPVRRDQAPALNLVLIIGDGMGAEHIRATSLFLNGRPGALFMQSAPHQGTVKTRAANNPVTDSAAAATAMATGHKVNTGVLALAFPGSGGRLTTLVEHFAAQGRLTGLITTNMLADATPAGFGSHAAGRKGYAEISQVMLDEVRPNLLFGGSANKDPTRGRVGGIDEDMARAAGYTVVTDRKGLAAPMDVKITHVAGLFGEAALPWEYDAQQAAKQGQPNPFDRYPHLSEMSLAAVEFLARPGKGFFLMIEGGLVDNSSHQGKTDRALAEVAELDRTVALVVAWALPRKDSLVVATADHETGGLEIVKANPAGVLPEVKWTTGGHTGVDVPIFAWGPGAEKFASKLDNTDIFRLLSGREPYPPKAVRETEAAPAPAPAREPAGVGAGY